MPSVAVSWVDPSRTVRVPPPLPLQPDVLCSAVDTALGRLTEAGFSSASLIGDMPAAERAEETRRFRAGETRLMVTTDLFGKGIDVAQVGGTFTDLVLGAFIIACCSRPCTRTRRWGCCRKSLVVCPPAPAPVLVPVPLYLPRRCP